MRARVFHKDRYVASVLITFSDYLVLTIALGMTASVGAQEVNEQQISVQSILVELVELAYIGGGEALPKLSLSPQKDAVAFSINAATVDDNRFEITWYVLELSGGQKPRFVGAGGDVILNIRQRIMANGPIAGNEAKWSPDGNWIAYPVKKDSMTQIWRSSRDGEFQEQVTFNEADVFGSNRYEALFEWSADGSKIYYEVARSRRDMVRQMAEEGERGYLFDDRFEPHAAFKPFWTRCGGSRQGEFPVVSQACEPTLWARDLTIGSERLATAEETAEYRRIRGEVDDGGVNNRTIRKNLVETDDGTRIWFQNIDPDTYPGYNPPLRLHASLPDGTDHACSAAVCQSVFLDAAWGVGDAVLFQRREGEGNLTAAFYAWNPRTDEVHALMRSIDSFSECQSTASNLICFHETNTQPRRLVAMDVESGTVTELFDPNPQRKLGDFTRVERLSWSNEKGQSTSGSLVYPHGYAAGTAYPLVLTQGDSSGFLSGGSGGEIPVHLLAKEGFFVLQASPFEDYEAYARYRGAELANAEFKDYERRKRALSAYTQIIEQLVEEGLVDRDRIAITGISSHSANARYALVNSSLFATALLGTGYSGPQQYWFSPSLLRQRVSDVTNNALPFSNHAAAFDRQEQLGYFARTHRFPPVLWQVADTELSHALFDHVLLKDEGHPVEMYVFPDELHVKYQPIHRLNVFRRNLQWLKFWLQGETTSDPMDPDQYSRWSKLCQLYVDILRSTDEPGNLKRADKQRCIDADQPSFP